MKTNKTGNNRLGDFSTDYCTDYLHRLLSHQVDSRNSRIKHNSAKNYLETYFIDWSIGLSLYSPASKSMKTCKTGIRKAQW